MADAALNHAIVTGCLRREPTLDFLSAHRASIEGLPDLEVLAIASRENRILVTSDFKTMPWHFAHFLETEGYCAGVFLVKQSVPVADVIVALLVVWAASEATIGKIGSSKLRKSKAFEALPT